jgi:hypothetical protein
VTNGLIESTSPSLFSSNSLPAAVPTKDSHLIPIKTSKFTTSEEFQGEILQSDGSASIHDTSNDEKVGDNFAGSKSSAVRTAADYFKQQKHQQ